MNEYDVDIWTDYNQFYLIVSAETKQEATDLTLDYLTSIKLVDDEEHLTRVLAKQIKRLTVPSVQWMRGTFGSKVKKE